MISGQEALKREKEKGLKAPFLYLLIRLDVDRIRSEISMR